MNAANDYIRIALGKASGNKTNAKKALLDMAAKDAHLAQILAAPFLDAICTQAIDRYLRQSSGEEVAPLAEPPAEEKKPEEPRPEASPAHREAVLKMVAAFQKNKGK